MRYFLSLGSNLGDREMNLCRARDFLEAGNIKILSSSAIYETQPVDYVHQPWFLNQAVEVETGLPPEHLLDTIKKIEEDMGRTAGIPKGPRIIDIDILLAENLVSRTPKLEIPHPQMHKRKFVLTPLKEIAKDLVHPVFHLTVKDLWERSEDPSEVRTFTPKSFP